MAVDILARGLAALAKQKAESLGDGVSLAGSIDAISDLPEPSASTQGQLYITTEELTTTADFVGGAGVTIPAGTTIGIVKSGGSYLYDATFGQLIDLTTLDSRYLSVSGTVTLAAASWSEGSYAFVVVGAGEADSIMFSPSTADDKLALADADVIVVTAGTTITFTAAGTVPTSDIVLNYTIVRGKS